MMPLTVIPFSSLSSKPWKNGGGQTFDVDVYPAAADLNGFEWRVSFARVAQDGPFSDFPAIDRTLTVIDGAGMILASSSDHGSLVLTSESDPYSFAGEQPITATLLAGPVLDLNVMTRRDLFRHKVVSFEMTGSREFMPFDGFLVVRRGIVTIGDVTLTMCDGVRCEKSSADPFVLRAEAPAVLVRIDIMPHAMRPVGASV